jgi:hypothetical protein
MNLNHMNGRVQDAVTGRFLSADPHIPDPGDPQSYNRYSYVINNPLSQTDPTGFDNGPGCDQCVQPINPDDGGGQNDLQEVQVTGQKVSDPAPDPNLTLGMWGSLGGVGTSGQPAPMETVNVFGDKPKALPPLPPLKLQPLPLPDFSYLPAPNYTAQLNIALGLCPNGSSPSIVNDPSTGSHITNGMIITGTGAAIGGAWLVSQFFGVGEAADVAYGGYKLYQLTSIAAEGTAAFDPLIMGADMTVVTAPARGALYGAALGSAPGAAAGALASAAKCSN